MEAREVREIMEAYASMYSQVIAEAECEDEEESEEEETPKMNGKKKEKKEKEEKEDEMKEEVDLFDYLLEYLVAEGYADTNKAALAIMANMSEEWKQDIVEAKYGTKAGRKALAKKIRKGEEIGKSGPGTGFKAVEKAAKEGGARDPQAVAAAAMWKAHGGKKG
jgi:hypothetical protein